MSDRERTHLINSFERLIPHAENGLISVSVEATKAILSLLKEQEEQIKNRDESLEKAREEIKWLRGMLKEQEAKVLTLDQLEDALDTVVWLETPVSENLADGYSLIMAYSHKYGYMYFDSPFGDNPSQDRLEYSEYGRSWRCWDRRPSEEQRKAVKEEDNAV